MGLQAEPPLRVGEAVLERELGVAREVGPVHRLQEEVVEVAASNVSGWAPGLREDQLQFVAARRGSCRRRPWG